MLEKPVKDEMQRLEDLQGTMQFAFASAEELQCIKLTLQSSKIKTWTYDEKTGILENVFSLVRQHPDFVSCTEVKPDGTANFDKSTEAEQQQPQKCKHCGQVGEYSSKFSKWFCSNPYCERHLLYV